MGGEDCVEALGFKLERMDGLTHDGKQMDRMPANRRLTAMANAQPCIRNFSTWLPETAEGLRLFLVEVLNAVTHRFTMG